MCVCSFLNQLSAEGHLGYFHVLAIVNCAAMNIGVHVYFWIRVFNFSVACPEVELLDHVAALFWAFWGNSILFSIAATPIYITTSSAGGASQVALVVQMAKNLLANAGHVRDEGSVPGLGRSPGGGGMATHSNILAWRIPRTEEPGELQSAGSHRVRHDWSDLACK